MTFSSLFATAALHSFVAAPGKPCFVEKLTPSGSPTNYGVSVGADGEHVVLGGPGGEGVAVFFRRVGNQWTELNLVYDPAAGLEQAFGWAVAIDGERAVIGAPKMDPAGSGPGHAYVFTFDGSIWGGQTALVSSDSADNDRFGIAVGIHDGRIIVGADRGFVGGGGAAYVFRWSGTTWLQEAKLVEPGGMGDGGFAWSVDIDFDLAVVAGDRTGNDSEGAVFVYQRSGSSWTFDAEITPDDPVQFQGFGTSVTLDGNLLLVGAPGDSEAGGAHGAVYVFERTPTQWVQRQKLSALIPGPDEAFGSAVASHGPFAFIGASGSGASGGHGTVYVFERRSTWQQVAKFVPMPGDNLGLSVAVGEGTGASGGGLGNAYVYGAPCIPATGAATVALLAAGLAVCAVALLRKRHAQNVCAVGVSTLLAGATMVSAVPPTWAMAIRRV